MPIVYEIDTVRNVVVTRYSGGVTESEFQEYYGRLVQDPRFRPNMCNLILATEVTSSTVESDSVRTVVGKGGWVPPRRAYVLPKDKPAIYGMSRMSSTYWELKGSEGRFFETEAEAWDWLSEFDESS